MKTKSKGGRKARASDRSPLPEMVRAFLTDLGAVKAPALYELRIETACGPLDVTPYAEWVACRFADVERAKARLPHGYADRLNRHTGKWNFHYFGCRDVREAFADFTRQVNEVLE